MSRLDRQILILAIPAGLALTCQALLMLGIYP